MIYVIDRLPYRKRWSLCLVTKESDGTRYQTLAFFKDEQQARAFAAAHRVAMPKESTFQ